MSQAARALVERLKRETKHLPSNTPQLNIALATIAELFDQCVEPEEVEDDPAEEPEPEVAAEPEAAQEPAGGGEGDAGAGPMTTGNAPT